MLSLRFDAMSASTSHLVVDRNLVTWAYKALLILYLSAPRYESLPRADAGGKSTTIRFRNGPVEDDVSRAVVCMYAVSASWFES